MSTMSAVMVTANRQPQENYLADTLINLENADLDCPRLTDLQIFDMGENFALDTCHEVIPIPPLPIGVHSNNGTVETANNNVSRALVNGARTGAEWVLFLEDDISVISNFFDAILKWLAKNASQDRRVYPLGAAYDAVDLYVDMGMDAWNYPIDQFYGTQAFVLRAEDAFDLATYLAMDPYRVNETGTAWDIIMAKWAKEKWPEIGHFLTPAPSFVQHIGMSSIVQPRDVIHTFESFPGEDWSYE